MSEQLHPGIHPDADSLSAFVEGVLPEHERAKCLEHLAECSRCRGIVYLSQDPPVVSAVPKPAPTPIRRRWFQPMPLLAAAAMVCAILAGAWMYLRLRTGSQPVEVAARISTEPLPTKEVLPSAPAAAGRRALPTQQAAPVQRMTPAKTAPEPQAPRRQPEPAAERSPAAPVATPDAPRTNLVAPGPKSADSSSAAPLRASTQPPPQPAPQTPAVTVQAEVGSPLVATLPLTGIAGTVTDASGAVVPGATVQLRSLVSNPSTETRNARTDPTGQFKFTGLSPGPYELQIDSPGFRRTTQRVEVKPQEVASVKPEIQVGTSAETVTVEAAVSTVQTSTSTLGTNARRKQAVPPEPKPLPSRLPVEITVTRNKIVLAVDTAGALFFSGNSGQSWKAVKSQWPGKIVRLETTPELSKDLTSAFQISTDAGSVWLSRDGRRWYPAPPAR